MFSKNLKNAEELTEMFRRRKVLNGEWPEEESHELLQ
jgi:superfamily II DNA or RNA helicase